MCVKASFLHDNQVTHPEYQCFFALIIVDQRKIPLNLFTIGDDSLSTHPQMYHQRSVPSRIHLQLHVKGVVLSVSSMHRTQIGMFRPIRMDHTNCLQVAIKTLQFCATIRSITVVFRCSHSRRELFYNKDNDK